MTLTSVLLASEPGRSADLLAEALARGGCLVSRCHDPVPAPAPPELAPGVVVFLSLDLDQPGLLERFRALRAARPDCRLCVLLAGAASQAAALESGADAVLSQPVEETLLLAQLRALARTIPGGSDRLRCGPLEIDAAARRAVLQGQILPLTDAEFDLLLLFANHPGVLLTRDRISQQIRGRDHDRRDRSLDLRVARLRRKLGDDPRRPRFIRSVRGEGYVFLPPRS